MPEPLPASQTKHLSTLLHPLPRNPSILLSLRQISSIPSTSSTPSSLPSSTTFKPASPQTSGSETTVTRETTGTTGTTLWLSSQIVANYLLSLPHPHSHPHTSPQAQTRPETRERVLELGSGVGYLSLVLSSMGYDVVASDVEPVLSSVLLPNIEDGLRVLRSTSTLTVGRERGGGRGGGGRASRGEKY